MNINIDSRNNLSITLRLVKDPTVQTFPDGGKQVRATGVYNQPVYARQDDGTMAVLKRPLLKDGQPVLLADGSAKMVDQTIPMYLKLVFTGNAARVMAEHGRKGREIKLEAARLAPEREWLADQPVARAVQALTAAGIKPAQVQKILGIFHEQNVIQSEERDGTTIYGQIARNQVEVRCSAFTFTERPTEQAPVAPPATRTAQRAPLGNQPRVAGRITKPKGKAAQTAQTELPVNDGFNDDEVPF